MSEPETITAQSAWRQMIVHPGGLTVLKPGGTSTAPAPAPTPGPTTPFTQEWVFRNPGGSLARIGRARKGSANWQRLANGLWSYDLLWRDLAPGREIVYVRHDGTREVLPLAAGTGTCSFVTTVPAGYWMLREAGGPVLRCVGFDNAVDKTQGWYSLDWDVRHTCYHQEAPAWTFGSFTLTAETFYYEVEESTTPDLSVGECAAGFTVSTTVLGGVLVVQDAGRWSAHSYRMDTTYGLTDVKFAPGATFKVFVNGVEQVLTGANTTMEYPCPMLDGIHGAEPVQG